MWERIRHMLIKEFIQVFRDPKMKGVIFAMPIIQVMVFGYAVTTDVKHVALAIFDRDSSQTSRDLVSRFVASEYFDIAAYVQDDRQAREVKQTRHVVPVGVRAQRQVGTNSALRQGISGRDRRGRWPHDPAEGGLQLRHHLAVDVGSLVKKGSEIFVSTRNAVRGRELGELKEVVVAQYREIDEREKKARTAAARLEAARRGGFYWSHCATSKTQTLEL
mgnify:CR=1 FL=1